MHIFSPKSDVVRESISGILNQNIMQKGYIVLNNKRFPFNISMEIVMFVYGESVEETEINQDWTFIERMFANKYTYTTFS